MGKLMVVVTRFLSLCAVLLALPGVVAAQFLAPGWYRNSGPSTFYKDSELSITWENSYIYPYPAGVPLYWYAQVIYRVIGSQPYTISCPTNPDPSIAKEHIRGVEGIPPNGDGFVPAEDSFCTRNPGWTNTYMPGETLEDWVIFHNVPGAAQGEKGEISLEWGTPYGSSAWVDPWHTPFNAPPPAVCPHELVALGTCLPVSRIPEGRSPNLIVLVHGCCTDANDVRKDWDRLGRKIAGKILDPRTWEVVVWDWHDYTPKLGYPPLDLLLSPRTAYDNVIKYDLGHHLATAIVNHRYEYVHLITHSAGANLIHLAATELAAVYKGRNEEPFIHLTFLDAFTLSDSDIASYGFLPHYSDSKHYAEHYVHRGFAADPASTDGCLGSAFNFDITRWSHFPWEDGFLGHQWPVNWYKKSVTTPGFGFRLSLEGGNNLINDLAEVFPLGKQCSLSDNDTNCTPADCWQ